MQLSIGLSMSGLSEIVTSHNGEEIVWRGNTYNRLKVDSERFFDDINAYWAELPFGQQTAIWNVYKKMNAAFTSVNNGNELHRQLKLLVREMYELHPMPSLNYWVRMKSRVKYPADLMETYSPEYPKEMTYLRSDYTGLLTVVLALRIILPLLSRYIIAAEQSSGNEFKEFVTMKLIDGSALDQYEHFQRLAEYVGFLAQNEQNKPSLSVLLGGLGTSQVPRFLLALAVVRRVAVAELKTSGEPVNIVSNVWHYVTSSLRDIDKRFGGTTKFKDGSDSGGEDDKQSVAETYKMRQEVAEATTIPDSVFIRQYIDVGRQIDPTVSEELLQQLWNHTRIMTTFSPSEFQMQLTAWALAPVLSARSLPYLEQDALMRAISIAQGLYWHWGFPDIAALMTAVVGQPSASQSDILGGRAWIPPTKEMLEVLDQQYPYWKRISKKQQRMPESNFALVDIRQVFQDITKYDWLLKAPKDLLSQVTMTEYDTGFEAPKDLEYQLVDFVIKNNVRKQQFLAQPTGV